MLFAGCLLYQPAHRADMQPIVGPCRANKSLLVTPLFAKPSHRPQPVPGVILPLLEVRIAGSMGRSVLSRSWLSPALVSAALHAWSGHHPLGSGPMCSCLTARDRCFAPSGFPAVGLRHRAEGSTTPATLDDHAAKERCEVKEARRAGLLMSTTTGRGAQVRASPGAARSVNSSASLLPCSYL